MASAPSSTLESSRTTSISTSASIPRVTRSSARLAAGIPSAAPSTDPSTATTNPTLPAPKSRKRKTLANRDTSPESSSTTSRIPTSTRAKRRKVAAADPSPPTIPKSRRRATQPIPAMANSGSSPGPSSNNETAPVAARDTARRKSSRNKKAIHDVEPPQPTTSAGRRSKKAITKKPEDVVMRGTDGTPKPDSRRPDKSTKGQDLSDEDDEGGRRGYEEDDDDDGEDPFRGNFLSHGGPSNGISNTLRALSGMVSGASSRLREILNNLRQREDPSVQLIALQDLSELLLVSTEDNLSGQFSPDQFVKELVLLMQPNDFGEENPEMMLLACRCMANLMEALPPSTANVVYGGAVPILCQKLLEIHFIDLAEQALSTLEKISVEFPSAIVREGGLTACLTYLDFFATSTQRTAVTTAANCCRNIPQDSFPVIRDVMPILLNVLGSSDQKVVEQGSLCVSRVVESFKYQEDKLEELISTDLLKAIRRLLIPGTTNLIGPNIHTQFLRVLSITARASPTLSAELFKMNIVDTIYQILTGLSPPNGLEDVASELDSVLIMQALIHRPREQVYETLNVICELLPGVHSEVLSFDVDSFGSIFSGDDLVNIPEAKSIPSPNARRIELLKGCQEELKRFAIVLLPTLTDAYSSTVNLSVRQKVLTAQLKMLSNLDTTILEDALCTVPYASYLASIFSQQDHPTLVTLALEAAELLLVRLEPIYRYQFYREGVMAEIVKLSNQPLKHTESKPKAVKVDPEVESPSSPLDHSTERVEPETIEKIAQDEQSEDENNQDGNNQDENNQDENNQDENNQDEDEEDDDDEPRDAHDDVSPSPSESSSSEHNYTSESLTNTLEDYIVARAKKFLDTHEQTKGVEMRDKASGILDELQTLAKDIEKCYLGDNGGTACGTELFSRLSTHFLGDSLESITSSELLHSEIVRVLLDVLSNPNDISKVKARREFLEVFMSAPVESRPKIPNPKASSTPFGILVHKLQDLLSRAEHFEVLTVHQNALDNNRSSASSMLSKQFRLKLTADDESETPRPYRNLIISIHAIATFQNLDEYLRPRISLSERPRSAKHREGVTNALAAFAAAAGIPTPSHRSAEQGETGMGEAPSFSPPSNLSSATRNNRKVLKNKLTSPPPEQDSTKDRSTNIRRSSRRRQPVSQASSEAVAKSPEQIQAPLECADERQLSDDDDIGDSNALDAIVDDLEDGMEAESLPDPTAVNLEVAPTGKVTARKDDGTRVSTPSQALASLSSTPSSRSRELLAAGVNPALASRAMYYAAAIQAVPQDWHLEFTVNGHPVSKETTIYQAVHSNKSLPNDSSSRSRNLWSALHIVKFKRVPGPPPSGPSSLTPLGSSLGAASLSMPGSLHEHSETSTILRLLNILHEMNANLDDVFDDSKEITMLNAEPLAQFVNTKLTAKLNRQLEEPLIVASNCLPSWSQDLARLYPFLFPFETRHLFLQSTSFGYYRSMQRWQNQQSADETRRDRHREDRPFIGRLPRQKVRIARSRILESAIKVMELYGASPSILEVEYFEEVGTGLGPTLEFYSSVSKEFSKREIKLWRENESNQDGEYVFSKSGLFPAPMSSEQAETASGKKVLHLFKMLGKFIARSMLDSRIIDVSLNPTFFRIADYSTKFQPSIGAVKTVDPHLAKSLKVVKQFADAKRQIDADIHLSNAQRGSAVSSIEFHGERIENLGLDFTLPGYQAIELINDGSNIPVTIENVASYVEKVIDMTLGSGIQRQIDAFKAGFSQVFPYSALKAFTPDELVMLFGRVEEDWSLETLLDSIKADHGFNMDSRSVRNLLQTMSELSVPQRRNFLQFVTGSPKLPIGGFKSLTPMFTVVCKPSEPPYTSDDFLISVMTCANYVKLPDYTSIGILRERLMTAIEEGQGAFHLS